MIGSVIDKYEVLQKLGEGATATVYRGRHMTIGKEVAIKILHPHLSASSRNRERFNREARAVGRLSHQNIVSILDYSGQQADDCYIVTELVDGDTFLTLLEENGRLPSELAAMLGMELCSALGFAHAQGIIHRDIKPENVMLRRDGRVKLMDFGVARVLDEGHITLDGSLLGSPAYMSPQQALDEPLDGRSDLFSLGTVLFHAVTGHVPFAGTNASVILRNIIDGSRPEVGELAPEVSPALAAVIDRLLQPKPEDRYADAETARAALAGVVTEVGLTLDHPTLNLRNYLVSPKECLAALDAHLRVTLLDLGKARLGSGDPLGALQLFNRLLSIDEDNAEVVELIQALHQPAPTPRRHPAILIVAPLLVVVLAAAGTWFATRPEVVAPPGIVEAPEPVASIAEPVPQPSQPPSQTPATVSPPRPAKVRLVQSPAAVPPEAVLPARIILDNHNRTSVQILVDGTLVGVHRLGPTAGWVGTSAAPIELTPGPHRIEFVSESSEPAAVDLVVSAGQTLKLPVDLRPKPTIVLFKSWLPRECKLTIGTTHYGAISGIDGNPKIYEREPKTPVVFDCPEPVGRFVEELGATKPGGEEFLPDKRPPGIP